MCIVYGSLCACAEVRPRGRPRKGGAVASEGSVDGSQDEHGSTHDLHVMKDEPSVQVPVHVGSNEGVASASKGRAARTRTPAHH